MKTKLALLSVRKGHWTFRHRREYYCVSLAHMMKQEETPESTCEGEGNPRMRQPSRLIDDKFLVTETEITRD